MQFKEPANEPLPVIPLNLAWQLAPGLSHLSHLFLEFSPSFAFTPGLGLLYLSGRHQLPMPMPLIRPPSLKWSLTVYLLSFSSPLVLSAREWPAALG